MSQYYTIAFPNGNSLVSGLSPTFTVFWNLVTGSSNSAPGISEILSTGIYYFNIGAVQPISFLADAATTSPGSGRYVFGQLDSADRIDYFGTSILAFGSTLIALGQTITTQATNIGTTLVAIGNTSIAYGGTILADVVNQGTTLVAVGNTAVALGTTSVALGTTTVALGITSVALGNTAVAIDTNIGTTLVAIGNTSIAYGGTILADIVNQGATLVAIGNTQISIGISLTVQVSGVGSTASFIGDSATYPVDLFGYMKRMDALLEGQQKFIKGSGALSMYDLTGATLLSSRTITNSASLVTKV